MKCQTSPSVLAASPSWSQSWTTQKARPRHSHQNNNPEVVETIYRSIIHPKAKETTPCTTATETSENVSIKLPNHQLPNDMWRHHNMARPKKKGCHKLHPTVQIAPEPRNTANTTMFDGHKMLTLPIRKRPRFSMVDSWISPAALLRNQPSCNPPTVH